MTVDDLAYMQEVLQHHLSIVSQTKGEGGFSYSIRANASSARLSIQDSTFARS